MMYHLVTPTKAGIFIFQGIKTMGAGRNHFFHLIGVQHLNIGHRLHLEQKFVTGPFCRISRTALFGSQHGKTYIGLVQNLDKGLRYFFCPIVKTSRAAHPK